ncbi:MAG: hypothetical protein MRY21_05945 [Simkaniaceae bacterium]|nr:hypothetical protein [Simkaniaceae bacterium]
MLGLILPVFALVVTGWVLRGLKYISESMADDLLDFSMYIGMPILLANSFATAYFSRIWDWKFIGVWGIVVFGLMLIYIYIGAVIAKKPFHHVAVKSFAHCCGANLTTFGLAFIFAIFGRETMLPAALTWAVILLIYAFMHAWCEYKTGKNVTMERCLKHFAKVFFNPAMIGAIIGVLYSLTGFGIANGVERYLRLFEWAAVVTALVSFGALCDFTSFTRGLRAQFWPLVWKLAVMPAVVLWACVSFEVSAVWAVAGILIAGMPAAFHSAWLADDFAKGKASTDVHDFLSVSMIAGLVTLYFWMFILNHFYPTVFAHAGRLY